MTSKIFFLFRTLEPTLLIALKTLALDLGQKAELVRLLSYTLSSGTAKRGLGIAGLPLIRWPFSLQSQWPGVGVLALPFALALFSFLGNFFSFFLRVVAHVNLVAKHPRG